MLSVKSGFKMVVGDTAYKKFQDFQGSQDGVKCVCILLPVLVPPLAVVVAIGTTACLHLAMEPE